LATTAQPVVDGSEAIPSPLGDEGNDMSDVVLGGTVVAFFLVAATVVWACSRITADAAMEAGSETGVLDAEPKRT
jgi:hypothetical protein